MLIAFKTELKVNNKQRTELLKHSGVARHAWNWGLGLTKQILLHNLSNPEAHIKFPSAIDLHKWLVALVKPECPWYYEISKCAPQYALRNLRNLNASINLKNAASHAVSACGLVSADTTRVKQEDFSLKAFVSKL